MPTSYTSLIGLALPVTGELSGTWGDVVNNYITNYLDSAVAGTQTISGSQTAVTLSVTNGSSLVTAGSGATGSAQFQIINCTGNPAGLLTITAPASSRQYIIINATSTSQSVKIVGTGPTTGVTILSGEKAHVAWNGSDFVKIATQSGNGSFVDLTVSGSMTLSGGTANGVLYLNGSKVATSGSALTFDGTALASSGSGTQSLTVTSTATAAFVQTTGANTVNARLQSNASTAQVGTTSNHNFTIQTNSNNVATFDTSGNLLLGTTTTTNNLRLNESLAVVKAGSNTYAGMAITGYAGTTGGARPLIDFNRSRGTTDGSMTVLANGDYLGSIIFRGSDGTSFQDSAMISAEVDGTPGASDMPGRLTFWTSSDGSASVTERARITSGGVLLVGGTAVAGYGGVPPKIEVYNTNSSSSDGDGGSIVAYGTANTSGAGASLALGSLFSTGSYATFARVRAVKDNGNSGEYGGGMAFDTRQNGSNFSERARITSAGDLLVGQTTGGLQAARSFSWQGAGDGSFYISHSTANASGDPYIRFGYNATQIGTITQNGTTAVAYNTSSDYRLKENIQPMTGALERLAALKPCTYTWKSDKSFGEGFIAHEVAEVYPQAVSGEKDAVEDDGSIKAQGVDYGKLTPLLTAALQEAMQEIKSLKARIAALEAA